MAFPVDILTNVDHESLELAAEEYMSQLLYRHHDAPEYLSLPDSQQIEIGLCNVSFVPLYGTDTKRKLLALFSPEDFTTVVGLYLLGQWWGVEDVLKTTEASRKGLIKVSSLGERIVLYVLNRIVLRNEKSSDDPSFLCHCENETAKILWKDGEAIGFYSFKPKGSLCRKFLTQCYQLPVMDTAFVRKRHRGKGYGVKILEDFVGSFRNEYTGLKFPLSEAMYKVCDKYLSTHPADIELLWEVENIGSPFQRTLIANRLQKWKLKVKDQVVSKLDFEKDYITAAMEIQMTNVQKATEYTEEIMEQTTTDITKEEDKIPVTRRGRSSSNLKRSGIREHSEERLSKKIIRVEDIEAGVKSPVEAATEENLHKTFSVNVSESEAVIRSTAVTATVTNVPEFRGSQEEQEIEKDKITVTSEEISVTHCTTAVEINIQTCSNEESGIYKENFLVEIQGVSKRSFDQSHLQPEVDIEIVKMSTGTEEEQNKNLENSPVCEAEKEETQQMLDDHEDSARVTVKTHKSLVEVREHPEIHAKSIEKEQAHLDVELTRKKDGVQDTVMKESGKDLIEENKGAENGKAKNEDTVLLEESIEADSVKVVLSTEEVICDQQKQDEAETHISDPIIKKDTMIEMAMKSKLDFDEAEQIFTQSKLPQGASALTPSRRSTRLRHQPAKTTPSEKTTQKRSKHLNKAMMQEESEHPIHEPEIDESEAVEETQEGQTEEDEFEECKDNDKLTVETNSTRAVQTTQVEERVIIVPEDSELVERMEREAQSSVECAEVQKLKTTSEEDEKSAVMVTLGEENVVLLDLNKLSSEETGDKNEEMDIVEQEKMETSEKQGTKETLRIEEQYNIVETIAVEMPTYAATTEGSSGPDDEDRTPGHTTACKKQESEPEATTDVLLSQVEKKAEIKDIDQAKKEKQYPKQGKTAEKTESTVTPSRSRTLRDQPAESGLTVRCLRSSLKPIELTPITRSTRSKAVTQQVKNVEPPAEAESRIDEKSEKNEVIADVSQEGNEMENANSGETATIESGSSQLTELGERTEKEHQIAMAPGEDTIPVEAEPDEDVTEKEVGEMTANKEANLPRQADSDKNDDDVQEEKAQASTEISLRHRTISVQPTPRKKHRYVKKQEAEAHGENQKRHTEETEEIYQEENKVESSKRNLTEKQHVEEPEMIGKTSEMTENVRLPIISSEAVTSPECLDEMADTNTEKIEAAESSELTKNEEADTQEMEEPDGEMEKEDGTSLTKLQKDDAGKDETADLINVLTEQQLEVGESHKSEQELCNKTLEEEKQIAQDDTEMTPQEETVEKENTVGEQNKIEKQVLITEMVADKVDQDCVEIDDKEKEPQKSTEDACEKVVPFVATETDEDVGEEGAEEIKETNIASITDKEEEDPKMEQETYSEQQEPLNKNEKEPSETEVPMEMEQTYVDEGTTTEVEESASQVERTETNQSDNERTTRRSFRLGHISVTSTKTRKSTRLQKAEFESVKKVDASINKHNETLATSEEIEIVCIPIITEDTNLKSHDKTANKNIEDTPAIEPETSALLINVELDDKEVAPQILEEVQRIETEPRENDDFTTDIQLQEATVVLVDLNKLSQNTEGGESDTPEVIMDSQTMEQLEPDKEIISEHQLCKQQEELHKEEGSEKTHEEDLEMTTTADEDVALKEKESEMSSHAQDTSESVQEVFEEKEHTSTERSLRRRTIKVQSPPRRKSRRVQKQKENENLEDKTGKDSMPERGTEEMDSKVTDRDNKELTLEKSTIETFEKAINLAEADEVLVESGIEEINKTENKETDSVMTKETDKDAPEIEEEDASLEHQQNEPLVTNENKTHDLEIPMEMDPEVSSEQTFVVEGVNIQVEETISQLESTETNQSDDGKSTRRSAQPVTSTQKTRKSTRLQKVESEPIKEVDISINKCEISATSDETVSICIPKITEDTNLETLDETSETNIAETPTVQHETSALLINVELDDKEVTSQILEEVQPIETEPHEEEENDAFTPAIQLQKATVVLVDLSKLSQNREGGESDTPEFIMDSQTVDQLEPDKELNDEHQLCNLTSEEEMQQEEINKAEDTEKTPDDIMEKETGEKNMLDQKDITFEGKNLTNNLENQNGDKKIVEECKKVIDEDVQEILTSSEHVDAATLNETNKIQETERFQDSASEGNQSEMGILAKEGSEVAHEVFEEEAHISSERRLRRRTIQVQYSPRKSRQKQRAVIFKGKTEIALKEKDTVSLKGMGVEVLHEEGAEGQKSTVDATENTIPSVEIKPAEKVIEKGFQEIKDTNLEIESTHEMAKDEANLEQQENEPFVEKERETVVIEKHMEMAGVPQTTNEQRAHVLEETTIQIENMENSENNSENQSDEKEDGTLNTNQAENEFLVAIETIQEVEEQGHEGEDTSESLQENADQEQEENIQDKGEDELNTALAVTDFPQRDKTVFKSTSVEGNIPLESSDEEAPLITRSLRRKTLTVQSTPRAKSVYRHEESENKTNVNICGNDSVVQTADIEKKALHAEKSIVENLETEEESVFQENVEKTKVLMVEERDEILFESTSLENTEQIKTQEEHLLGDDQVTREQEEKDVSNVQDEEKLLQKSENESATESVQGSSLDTDETIVERRTLRKRTTAATPALRKSKRLCKQDHKQVKEAIIGQTESADVPFAPDDVTATSGFEGGEVQQENSDGDIHEETGGTKSEVRADTTQTDEENKEVMVQEKNEIKVKQHMEKNLDSSPIEGFTLELEVEETSDREDESRAAMESPQEKSDEAEENISVDDEKGVAIEKYVLRSRSVSASAGRRSTRLQHRESQKTAMEYDSDSESELQHTAQQRHQRKRKAITDSTPARRSKRHVRAKIF